MGYCVNHPDVKTFYRCSTCGKYICLQCLEKLRRPHKKKMMGFCCQECKNKYLEKHKDDKKKAVKKIVLGLVLVLAGLVLDVLMPNNPDSLKGIGSLDFTSFSVVFALLMAALNILVPLPWRLGTYPLIAGVWILTKGYDLYRYGEEDIDETGPDPEVEPQIKHEPAPDIIPGPKEGEENIDLESCKFYCRVKELEDYEKTEVINNLKQNAPYYIYLGKDVYKAVLKQLKYYLEIHGYNKEENLRDENIYIGVAGSGELYLYFNDSFEFYHYINLLECMYVSVDVEGFAGVYNELFYFKSGVSKYHTYGVDKKNECIQIDVSSGAIEDCAEYMFLYKKPQPKYDELVKIIDCRIKIENEVPGPKW